MRDLQEEKMSEELAKMYLHKMKDQYDSSQGDMSEDKYCWGAIYTYLFDVEVSGKNPNTGEYSFLHNWGEMQLKGTEENVLGKTTSRIRDYIALHKKRAPERYSIEMLIENIREVINGEALLPNFGLLDMHFLSLRFDITKQRLSDDIKKFYLDIDIEKEACEPNDPASGIREDMRRLVKNEEELMSFVDYYVKTLVDWDKPYSHKGKFFNLFSITGIVDAWKWTRRVPLFFTMPSPIHKEIMEMIKEDREREEYGEILDELSSGWNIDVIGSRN